MSRRKDPEPPPKLVWRITADTPLGEYVDPRLDAVMKRKKAAEERGDPKQHEHSWLGSSLELLGGVRVSETPMETLPGDLFDEFFKAPKKEA